MAIETELTSIEGLRKGGQKNEEALIDYGEKSTGAKIYRIPPEHEKNNLLGYLDPADTPGSLDRKLTLTDFIPDDCWRPVDVGQEDTEAYGATVYSPLTRAMITVVVGDTLSMRRHFSFLETYLTDPYNISEISGGRMVGRHQTDRITEEVLREKRLALQRAVTSFPQKRDDATREIKELQEAANLTQRFDRVKEVVLKK